MSAAGVPAELAPPARVSGPLRPRAAGGGERARDPRSVARALARVELWSALLVAAIACLIALYAKGGLKLSTLTPTEMALTLGGGAVVAGAILLAPARTRLLGMWPLALLLAFTGLSALSVAWSVQPDDSWHNAARLLSYSALFGAAIVIARLAPERWAQVLEGLALAAVVVCAYGIASKVFPATLAPVNAPARLQEPFGYWNAVGLSAAMGVICCLWLGARREGHALVSALAYPACGLLLLTLLLAYSRGALVATVLGVALWLWVVPLRLRGASVLMVGGAGAAAVAGWSFAQPALSDEGVELAQRTAAGHELGVLVLVMVAVLTLAGLAIGFQTSRRAPRPRARRRMGGALLGLLGLAALALIAALAHSHRGLTGSISHAFSSLTNPNAKTPPNTPGRLTAIASVRARYWKEALQVFKAHPLLGAGAEGYGTARLRYRQETLVVGHAHGFIVQTLADLGIVGLALVLALLVSWILAARRPTHPLRGGRYTPERIGMLSMLVVVVVFGLHSLIDWTWYVPGDACVALLCAGWLAGRGELAPAPGTRRRGWLRAGWRRLRERPQPVRLALAGTAVVAALLAAWAQWEPQRSEEARGEALTLAEDGHLRAAQSAAESAVSRDPLSAEALFALADVQQIAGRGGLARQTLQRAVRLQPSNPQTWLELGRDDLAHDPRAALKELQAAVYLNPETIAPEAISGPTANRQSVTLYNDYIQALRASGAGGGRGGGT